MESVLAATFFTRRKYFHSLPLIPYVTSRDNRPWKVYLRKRLLLVENTFSSTDFVR
ncbi:hypothetical protein PVAP13_3KG557800 [Panicum virgatum]|uniref:Uncharacterized protein n=1 Tax=Panicum virgatum TaxID=38727 RepID=A0A8T0VBM5_PANVG|nr:hypothetical protein PVAP13_3KG557800 [Panicum virgatum]